MPTEIRNIKSVQVFSTVADVLNVTRAAQLLNTSQSTISYHIQKLEADLDTVLFRRNASGLELTESGSILAGHVMRGLEAIRTGIDQATSRAGTIEIALLPMFASRWLSPRLGGLLEANPGVQLVIKNHNNNFAHMPNPERFADIGVQWGRGNWSKFEVTKLWTERLVVVCSPEYLKAHPIRKPSDLAECTLLHVDDTRMWEEWFTDNDVLLPATPSQMMLEDRHFQLSSTINGLGVSLFASWAVRPEIESGALVNPFDTTFATSFAYHLIVPLNADLSPSVRKFQEELLDVSGNTATKS
ncbi:LysR substrate-binding domain-containing protein [Aestuariicoccus sp. MJ-SS9]|uniref:LysR substrate-binding domain-containing protein n=1 Tax=Aestuariicoccus sp. MJ-SS9 TaxID=3079855 RepID=UPI002913F88B|nr:LysR substrate-binding domain-containing protein [Aestuariicoccus sp. MJ-SS9]MDU8912295.1 LysR substrate-binding domain-containing protein [Aestuariicoccus sp. MJ-SS9]